MSLGIAFKGPEGIVLAADSRVTLTGQLDGTNTMIPAYYDNAIKLLEVKGQEYVGAVTYGQGALGGREPRTAHSYLPEFEREITDEGRLTVEQFATKLGNFFQRQWDASAMPPDADPMVFLVGGFDRDAAYGRVFEVQIPTTPTPKELNPSDFGITFGGQNELAGRLLGGYDPKLMSLVGRQLNLDDRQIAELEQNIGRELAVRIPYQFLPLQDSIDLAIFLIKATATIQKWLVGIRGVGGAIDVATITRTEGFRAVQQKIIAAERYEF